MRAAEASPAAMRNEAMIVQATQPAQSKQSEGSWSSTRFFYFDN
jgi:hypothetical protein